MSECVTWIGGEWCVRGREGKDADADAADVVCGVRGGCVCTEV